jgi:hypothetical protein
MVGIHILRIHCGPNMIEQLKSWKLSVERLLSAAEVDWQEAARLAAEIAGKATDAMLRQAATQAIPILRSAAQSGSDHSVTLGARRRLGILLDVLQELSLPRFGMRSVLPKRLTAEERARKLLNLPLGKSLAVAEIRQAFRRAAKSVHPDAGGSEEAFLELIAAQDVLMHPGAHKGE